MSNYAKQIQESDNVVTAVAECKAGDRLTVRFKGKTQEYPCLHDVPFGHKIAIKAIPAGAHIVKYGEVIGSATQDIAVGEWVHTHNVHDDYKCLDKDGTPLPGQDNDTSSTCAR